MTARNQERVSLVVATGNVKKLHELKTLLEDLPYDLKCLKDFEGIQEVEEDGASFQENAKKKALRFAAQTGHLTLAEDSGLVIDYLNGAPGIYSARYAGLEKNDNANNEKVLRQMEQVPKEQRQAAFHCAVCLAKPGHVITVFEERVEGLIAEGLRGSGGFGYDPLFFYPKFGKTFGEVPAEMKHSVSHRGKALARLKQFLKQYLDVL